MGNCGKIHILKPVHCGKTTKKIQILKPVPLASPKKIPTNKPSHLPLVSPHICLKITKDIGSQRLTVCCHSVGLSTKNEQELRLGLESMVKIIDPSPLPIPYQQSKMLPPSTVTQSVGIVISA
jgi:hypothetical protein